MMEVRARRTAVFVGSLPLLMSLGLAGCAPSAPAPSGSTSASPTASPTGTSTPTASPTPTAAPTVGPTSSPPPDDQTKPPQSGDKVISSHLSHDWGWPGPGSPFLITHSYSVPIAPPPAPPLPYLYTIAAGAHPTDHPPYDQLSFRFKGAFPSYDIEYVPTLVQDGSGATIPMPGTSSILRVVFHTAQAHTESGTSTIVSKPPAVIGYKGVTRYAPAGDFEGYVSYGIGVGRPGGASPHTPIRVYEVEKIEQGQHLYVVAIQVDTTNWK